ncbi:aromatic-ring-hydroxylating dioxygenase subunit beta [Sphingomonadaceae bacterium G21617-S1]|uniref:aromatic-ring-hydroxylating dioxygenase subunit beta n=1 Tax=Rhizorhabdus sp. TaxID=1968843 RepID=UPI001201C321|nr:aromatic-ring-hydroxylating dioxygenase subunit beta [Rhizorhabdus sp.]MBD3761662.1 hypothetical protein [Rhizorhabdus sp.]MCZ4343298.1 aromatic-ring-hydroxylating dioxygenase subunit beta [Sphingomonadaceae bacterium G21617-S1]TAK06280.1 MAG: hypothetical protein EPO38_14460 [Rhizorhabdus sp.]
MSAVVQELPRRLITRLTVEDFLYREAALLDAWKLDEWLALFDLEGSYEVTPVGIKDPETVSRAVAYFLVGDDYERLQQRIVRLQKPSAHVEWPRSETRHCYTNVIVEDENDTDVRLRCNFITRRMKRGVTEYCGTNLFHLVRAGDDFKIKAKRVILAQDVPYLHQGTVSMIL